MSDLVDNTDVVVVGGNVAGTSIATGLAKRGVNVVVVDRLEVFEIGRYTCGDGLEKYQFQRLGLELPKGPFVIRKVHSGQFVSPDLSEYITVYAEALGIDRFKFNQWLISQACSHDVVYIDQTCAEAPVLENDRCVGLRVFDKRKKEHYRINATVTVDASGFNGALRRKLPQHWPVSEPIEGIDTGLCYREVRQLEKPLEHDVLMACFSRTIAPGGIYWLGSRDERKVNVGIGVRGVPEHPNPRRQLHEQVIPRHPFLKGSKILHKGGGIVPVRRPLDSMVASGFLTIGDAACQTNPISGSGIGTSMFAGQLGAKVIANALETGETDLKTLWTYNIKYNHQYGWFQAGNQCLRSALQSMSDEELNILFRTHIIDSSLLLTALKTGEVTLDFSAKLSILSRLGSHPRLIRKLNKIKKQMNRARELYKNYPKTPEGFDAWRKKQDQLLQQLPHSS